MRASNRLRLQQTRAFTGYPNVLVDLEYRADVYALAHEFYGYRCNTVHELAELLLLLTQTLWAFERLEHNDSMESARLTRYLLLHWQRCHLLDQPNMPLAEAWKLLAARPTLQLRATTRLLNEQQLYDLKDSRPEQLGLALLHNNQIQELHDAQQCKALLTAFRERDPIALEAILTQFLRTL